MASPRCFESPEAFRAWLEANASTAHELLVGYHKVAIGRPCMTWGESVDGALRFGWIPRARRVGRPPRGLLARCHESH
jgi:uncharacterized protein YdeI (YjbR/CyaY-like superfamily)